MYTQNNALHIICVYYIRLMGCGSIVTTTIYRWLSHWTALNLNEFFSLLPASFFLVFFLLLWCSIMLEELRIVISRLYLSVLHIKCAHIHILCNISRAPEVKMIRAYAARLMQYVVMWCCCCIEVLLGRGYKKKNIFLAFRNTSLWCMVYV